MNDTPKLPALHAGKAVAAIVPETFDETWRIATAICQAGMAPFGLDRPEKATVAIMYGLEVGLTPMAALQSIAVINGRPTIWGAGALALVRGSGKVDDFEELIEGTGDNRVAKCTIRRKGQKTPIVRRFSVADAKKAGLWEKRGAKGQDTPWITYPERMLQMRARAWALRDGFADVLRGLGITEEVRDIEPIQDVTPSAPPRPPDEEESPGVEDLPVEETKPPQIPSEIPFDPDKMLEHLETELACAEDLETLFDVWEVADAMAQLEGFDEHQEIAQAMYEKRKKALENVAAKK